MGRIETIAEGVTLYPAECLAALAGFRENCVDSCVTDPPYHLNTSAIMSELRETIEIIIRYRKQERDSVPAGDKRS